MLNALFGYLFGLLVYPAMRKRRAVVRGCPLMILAALLVVVPLLACCLNAHQGMAADHRLHALKQPHVRLAAAHYRR